MPRKFSARYEGRCPACPQLIEVGDDLIDDDGLVVHFDCAGNQLPLVSSRPREVCPRCQMEQAANGECGCDL